MEHLPIVEIENLRVDYRLRRESLTVLEIPCWSVDRGEQVVLFGPSGCGKSTLLHVLSGVIAATAGTVRVCGTDLARRNEEQRDRFRACHVGYVFQNFNLLAGYTALENVLMGSTFHSRRADVAEANELLNMVGLAERRDHRPNELSFGEQQRVAIARALIKQPALVLADEPTGSLDPRNTAQVVRLLRAACALRNSTLVVVTHEQSVIAEFEQQVAYGELNLAWQEDEAVG
jgi:ABC-type lipoprotein export system ATPase subunit